MSTPIKNDPELLETLLTKLDLAKEPWRITPYWATYHDRMVREIKRKGLENAQNNYLLLKGFASGGNPTPIPPANPIKRMVFESIPSLPVFSKVFKEYQRLAEAFNNRVIKLRKCISKEVLLRIEERFGPLELGGQLDAGDAQDSFIWNGHTVTTSFVSYLSRAADFYSFVPMDQTTSLLEIGPGLGWSTIAHRTLNPNLRTILNVDIPTTLYISTQFLKSVGTLEVIDYSDFLNNNYKIKDPSGRDPICYQIPTWEFEKVNNTFDWLHNANSFQEMEPNVVKAYAKHSKTLITHGAWLLSSIKGHKPGAGGQKNQVSFDVIEEAFKGFKRHDYQGELSFSKWFGGEEEKFRIYYAS